MDDLLLETGDHLLLETGDLLLLETAGGGETGGAIGSWWWCLFGDVAQ
jgi:hypothetical protein